MAMQTRITVNINIATKEKARSSGQAALQYSHHQGKVIGRVTHMDIDEQGAKATAYATDPCLIRMAKAAEDMSLSHVPALRIAFISYDAEMTTLAMQDLADVNKHQAHQRRPEEVRLEDGTIIRAIRTPEDILGHWFDQVIVAEDHDPILDSPTASRLLPLLYRSMSKRIPEEFQVQHYDLSAE